MFLARLKTLLTVAMQDTFDADYPIEQFRDLHVSIEFPDDRQHYPSLWVDFEPTGQLTRAGVNHIEIAPTETGDAARAFTTWRFQGYATYTIAAMTSLERDLLFDEVVRVLAFGGEDPATNTFRATIETSDLLDVNIDFDEIGVRGTANTPGTPWGTDEMIYETTIAMEVLGEFRADMSTGTLLPLTAIEALGFTLTEGDPSPEW